MALAALSTMMQQQMDEIVEYLQEISEKVDDILRNQKDAVFADMIGAELIIEEALTVREHVGRVSEVTWSKVQATSMTIASTQAYAVRQLDAIAKKLEKKADLCDVAKATEDAAPKVREWLAVLARCFQLRNGISVLELDRVLDASPEEIDRHRLGVTIARQNRLELITRSTARLLTQMDETVQKANAKVLLNPFDSPAAVRWSKRVASDVGDFRERLGIESGSHTSEAKRWAQAATEVRDKVVTKSTEGVDAARRFGAKTFDQAAEALRAVDIDGDGAPKQPRVLSAVERAALGKAADAAGAVGSLLHRKKGTAASPERVDSDKPAG